MIPETNVTITQEETELLQYLVNPLTESDNYGIELYERVVAFLQENQCILYNYVSCKLMLATKQLFWLIWSTLLLVQMCIQNS